MPTFLTTRKMSPELARRVEASVRGQRYQARNKALTPSVRAGLRLALMIGVLSALATGGWLHKRAGQRLEADRADLLASIRAHASALTAQEKALPSRIQPWLESLVKTYAGDEVDEELRKEGALARTLERSVLYVRGPLAGFQSADAIGQTARSSVKDALVACLIEPPASKAESALLKRARRVYSREVQNQTLERVARLHHALVGLPFLSPTWQAYVNDAEDSAELHKLRRLFEMAPIEQAKRAARAELLVVAVDEPGDSTAPAELDGERPHSVRIALVDLLTSRLLLRLRRHVDPSTYSAQARAEHAAGLDACSLALDVRAAAGQSVSALR